MSLPQKFSGTFLQNVPDLCCRYRHLSIWTDIEGTMPPMLK
jgi:hypothetical protein